VANGGPHAHTDLRPGCTDRRVLVLGIMFDDRPTRSAQSAPCRCPDGQGGSRPFLIATSLPSGDRVPAGAIQCGARRHAGRGPLRPRHRATAPTARAIDRPPSVPRIARPHIGTLNSRDLGHHAQPPRPTQ